MRSPSGLTWLYGHHAVRAALGNPKRVVHRLLYVKEHIDSTLKSDIQPEQVTREEMAALLPSGAVHQGIAAAVEPLPPTAIEDVCRTAADAAAALVIVLDQVTDPQNIGAILRSAAVFGAAAVVVQDRHAPEVTGALAKAASGAVERVPLVRVTNLSRALKSLKAAGFWCIGLDAEAESPIEDAPDTDRKALVLGAEGAGLRRLTREACDVLVRIGPRGVGEGPVTSLNVSNATAVALYALHSRELRG